MKSLLILLALTASTYAINADDLNMIRATCPESTWTKDFSTAVACITKCMDNAATICDTKISGNNCLSKE